MPNKVVILRYNENLSKYCIRKVSPGPRWSCSPCELVWEACCLRGQRVSGPFSLGDLLRERETFLLRGSFGAAGSCSFSLSPSVSCL